MKEIFQLFRDSTKLLFKNKRILLFCLLASSCSFLSGLRSKSIILNCSLFFFLIIASFLLSNGLYLYLYNEMIGIPIKFRKTISTVIEKIYAILLIGFYYLLMFAPILYLIVCIYAALNPAHSKTDGLLIIKGLLFFTTPLLEIALLGVLATNDTVTQIIKKSLVLLFKHFFKLLLITFSLMVILELITILVIGLGLVITKNDAQSFFQNFHFFYTYQVTAPPTIAGIGKLIGTLVYLPLKTAIFVQFFKKYYIATNPNPIPPLAHDQSSEIDQAVQESPHSD